MQTRGSEVVEYWSDGVMSENAQCRSLSATLTADKRARSMAGLPAGPMAGFTLIELLVAIALGMVILAGLFRTFKVQHDSYVLQDQVSAMQQNLRAAMYLITRDLQMAGYYTNFDRNNRQLDWNDDGATEAGRPLLFARNNVAAGSGIKANTDVITIVKVGSEAHTLVAGEGASGGVITLNSRDLDGDGTADLSNTTGKKFGLLLKQDLSFADFFQVNSPSDDITPPPPNLLTQNYTSGDIVFRTDIIIYRVSDDPTHPCLQRRNLGSDAGYQVIAENIDNLQFRYQLNDGTWTDNPAGSQARVRAVEVLLVARTAYAQRGYRDTSSIAFGDYTIPAPNDAYRRRTLNSIVKTRNVGL
jgi:prepilin-type N-terminal cleavage/methylation domain-containing protein